MFVLKSQYKFVFRYSLFLKFGKNWEEQHWNFGTESGAANLGKKALQPN